jgi:hypothetical protein
MPQSFIRTFVQAISWNVLILPVKRGYQVKQSCPDGVINNLARRADSTFVTRQFFKLTFEYCPEFRVLDELVHNIISLLMLHGTFHQITGGFLVQGHAATATELVGGWIT